MKHEPNATQHTVERPVLGLEGVDQVSILERVLCPFEFVLNELFNI